MKHLLIALCAVLFVAAPAMAESTPVTAPQATVLQDNVRNYTRVNDKLATGGAVAPGGIAALADQGFTTVIDLRTPAEGTAAEQEAAEQNNLAYFNIPVFGADGITLEGIERFAEIYPGLDGPVLLHCASGNRAGAMWAAYLLHRGVAMEDAVEQGRKIGMKQGLEEQVRADFCTTC